jgi:hypothetical protein
VHFKLTRLAAGSSRDANFCRSENQIAPKERQRLVAVLLPSRGFGKGVSTMKKSSLLIYTSFAALCLATGAVAQSERSAPGAGGGVGAPSEMAPPSGADAPSPRSEPGTSGGALERSGPAGEKAGRPDRPEAQDRSQPRDNARDAARNKGERDGSGSTAGRATTKGDDSGDPDRGASTGASEGATGSDAKPSGSITQLSGEKRTKVQSAFRSHRSEAVVKDIDIDVSVGVAVPRTVTLYAVPEEVVVIVPDYRRYKYFIYEDKVVIVDPATFEIVDILILA